MAIRAAPRPSSSSLACSVLALTTPGLVRYPYADSRGPHDAVQPALLEVGSALELEDSGWQVVGQQRDRLVVPTPRLRTSSPRSTRYWIALRSVGRDTPIRSAISSSLTSRLPLGRAAPSISRCSWATWKYSGTGLDRLTETPASASAETGLIEAHLARTTLLGWFSMRKVIRMSVQILDATVAT